ncbi:MAG: hypothetical protein HFF36_08340 [Coprobacillus sp.]|nr:hypothetical protein [Coprobacillus sp.]
MSKKKKRIIKICMSLALFIIVLCIYDKLTTYQVSYGPTYIEERNGFIELRISLASSSAYVHHYNLVEINDGIYEIQIYASLTNGDYPGKIYKIDNRDGHIKKLQTVDGKIIYQKGANY